MAVKDILHGNEGFTKILKGVNTLAESVGCTMGYGGRTVLINKGEMYGITATKDGVSVAKEVSLKDRFEDMGAQIVYQAAKATGDIAGDGTTTSTVIAHDLINKGVELVRNNKYNLTEVKKGMEHACESLVEELDYLAVDVKEEPEFLKQIATISSNGDDSIGKLVSDAILSVDSDEVVIDSQVHSEDGFTKESGFKFESGMYSNHFESKQGTSSLEYENAKVLIINGYFGDIRDIIPVLKKCRENNKPLIIFAEEVNGNTLSALAKNNIEGDISVAVIKLPDAGDLRKYSVRDLSVATGAKMADKELEVEVKDIDYEDLGEVDSIKSNMESTSLVFKKDREDEINKLREEILEGLEASIENEDAVRARHLKVRETRFSEGVVKIQLSASTEIEFREKYDRVEDAVLAVLSAKSEGIIKGGGIGLLEAMVLSNSGYTNKSKSFIKGAELVKQSCQAPIKRILGNSGHNKKRVGKIIKEIKRNDFVLGYDVKEMEYADMFSRGIVDPVKVTKNALKNAVSVSSTIITSNAYMANHDFEQ